MCGIAGYINTKSGPITDSNSIISMLKIQKHRGPDDSGIVMFNLGAGDFQEISVEEPRSVESKFDGVIGFNRLSILDLSINGHQPMASPDKRVYLAFNGEIYNAFDYKEELQQWGYRFRSSTDTEIVLALYLKYGIDGLLDRLNGMFAIAIIDLGRHEIIISRDRFGIKPMYFTLTDKVFAFSSELKSFRYIENFNFRIDLDQLDEYLLFRNNIQGTLYEDILTLPPGYYLTYSHKEGINEKQYFDINCNSRVVKDYDDIEFYEREVKTWLSKSVDSQLMSDVKLGCQLSGGIDSTLVTWLANRSSNKGKFEAVSIIFNENNFSEERYINRVVDNLMIPSHKFLLDHNYFIDNIEKVTWHLEEPINHPNTVAIYKLSQLAKEHVTVLLSGEGADEIFGGYGRFYDISYPFQSRRLLHEIKCALRDPAGLSDYFNHEYRAVLATAFLTPSLAKKLRSGFSKEKAICNRRAFYRTLSGSLFDRQIKYEINTYLPALLIRQDKMSMAHSIENRVPFLDNEVVKNSFTIPEKHLLLRKSPEGYNNEKYLLKKLTSRVFGDDFAFRKKMGFGIPLKDFLLRTRFNEYLNDKVLPGIQDRGLFNHRIVSEWLSNIHNINYLELEALWVVVAFEVWASIYLDNKHENRYTSL
jgi:asparagine synthase (glutamine-hydrolysing)